MNREVHVRFWEGLRVRFPRATHFFDLPPPEPLFCFEAANTSSLSAASLTSAPSKKSMARRTLPSKLELKSLDGSGSEAPLAKVSFTAFLYVSPVQMVPLLDQTGVFHFHSSCIPGSD